MSVVPSTSDAIDRSSAASNPSSQTEDDIPNRPVPPDSSGLHQSTPVLLPPPPVGPLPIDPGTLDPTGSSAAALARSTASSLAFIFKRPPLRFFRPVKISTYGALQVMAEERGKPVSIKFVRSIIKTEGPMRFILNHVLPPFCFNTVIGLTLFTTYTTVETRLSLSSSTRPDDLDHQQLHPYLVPALAGGIAGAAQSSISAPLDNLRLLQTIQADSDHHRTKNLRFKGWIPLLKKVLLPLSHPIHWSPHSTNSERSKLWASRGRSMFGLSILKDSIGFATFFSLFQIGRDLGRRLASSVDQLMIQIWPTDPEDQACFEESRRGWTGRILQSFVIVLSGATAGWAYGLVAEPFERIRRVLWQARFDWASIHLYSDHHHDRHTPSSKHPPPGSSKPTPPSSHAHHEDRHKRLYDSKSKTRPIGSKTSKTKVSSSSHKLSDLRDRSKSSSSSSPSTTNLERERRRSSLLEEEDKVQAKQDAILRSERPPSMMEVLELMKLGRRRRSEDRRTKAFISILRRGLENNKLIQSTATTGIKLDDLGNSTKPTGTVRLEAHPKGLPRPRRALSSPRHPKIFHPPPSRISGFKSFILSPYSIGFFVWAVCSGDLST